MVHIRNERHNKKWLPENQLIPSFNLLYDHLLLFSAKGLIPLLIRPFCSFHPIFHVQHLFQLFPKGFILSSPFFFLVSDSGLFFFPAGNVDLLHTMLLLQDALGFADYEAESRKLKDRYNEIQTLLANYAQQSRDAKEFAALVEQYTNITELTEELLHTLIEKIVVHEKEVIDGETVMRIDIYYRFIGKVGSEDDGILITPKTRRASIPLAPGA